MRDPELSIAGWLLLGEARTLRELAFCRLVEGLGHDSIKFSHAPQQIFQIHPVESSLNGLMSACAANTWSRDRLASILISRPGRSALSDPERVPMLQDLANILAREATEVFSEAYFPGIPDVHVPEEHVEIVMRALQREMDREVKADNACRLNSPLCPGNGNARWPSGGGGGFRSFRSRRSAGRAGIGHCGTCRRKKCPPSRRVDGQESL